MYAAFLVSGLVDLIGFRAPAGTLPPGTEHVRVHGWPLALLAQLELA